ncbi:hypothetical protein SAMN02910401_00320 [Megasphaera elsdenii]|uniref:hypothetical protein n=1 Tax=Megasphaera elsdenii TaxID=907 RepID=UPI0008E9849B|nr:hypothetical protein [Megasphaera elsdenii]SFH78322.1 hypothetical protein SAMN02910401_00320 [Megasphaera elsdenii]
MKVTIKYYETGFASIPPEIDELEEIMDIDSKDSLIKYAKHMDLPGNAEYAHLYYDGSDEPIAVTRDGIRDMETGDWIVEPEYDED